MTREYAMASGTAELYERFSNNMTFMTNPYWCKAYLKESLDKNGFCFRKDEKWLSFDEWRHCCVRADEFFETILKNDEKSIKAFADVVTDGHYVGVPMKSLDGRDTMYVDPRLLMRISHSIGMAGGNTVNEALVQGLSEIIEKEGFDNFFKNADAQYFAINLDAVENEGLRQTIANLKSLGYKLYLIDLAYTFEIPVMLTVLVHPKDGFLNINFGSFPVFDIALERTLTEIYQGIATYKNNLSNQKIRIPWKGSTIYDVYSTYGNSIDGEIFPLSVLDNLKYVDTCNKSVYANKDSTNEELIQYYIDLGIKKNYRLYYIDNSLSDKIHAVYALLDNKKVYTNYESISSNLTSADLLAMPQRIKEIGEYYNKIFNHEKINYLDCIQMISNRFEGTTAITDCLGELFLWCDFMISEVSSCGHYYLKIFDEVIKNNSDVYELPQVFLETAILNPFKKYITLLRYLKTEKYTQEELFHIFNDIFNYDLTNEDIQKAYNLSYLVNKAYAEPLYNYINSKDFKDIVNTYVKNNQSLLL